MNNQRLLEKFLAAVLVLVIIVIFVLWKALSQDAASAKAESHPVVFEKVQKSAGSAIAIEYELPVVKKSRHLT